MADDDHLIEFTIMSFGAGIGASGADFLTETHPTVQPRITGGVVEEPDLIVFSERWIWDKIVDDLLKGIRRGNEAVDEDERDFLGIVGLDKVEAYFLREAVREDDVLDFEVIEISHVPVERVCRTPIGSEGVFTRANGEIVVEPSFGELPNGEICGIEAEGGGEIVGQAGRKLMRGPRDSHRAGFFPPNDRHADAGCDLAAVQGIRINFAGREDGIEGIEIHELAIWGGDACAEDISAGRPSGLPAAELVEELANAGVIAELGGWPLGAARRVPEDGPV